MNRRKFLNWLGVGVAVGAAAPSALFPSPSLSGWHWDMVKADAYADYSSFSQHALTADMEKMVADAAEELGRQAGLSIADLQAVAYGAV